MPFKPRDVPPEVEDAVREQAAAIASLVVAARSRLVRAGRTYRAGLRAALTAASLGRTGVPATSIGSRGRALVTAEAARHGAIVSEVVTSVATDAAAVGRESMADQLDYWRRTRPDLVIGGRERFARQLLNEGLLEVYSVERYTSEAVHRMRQQLSRSTLAGETIEQTIAALERQATIPRHRADTIARTETSFALHRQQRLDIGAAVGDDDLVELWLKQLVATFDRRTGDDSKFVHGQSRRPDQPFRDNEGRVYQLPPNRPNDREVVVWVPR